MTNAPCGPKLYTAASIRRSHSGVETPGAYNSHDSESNVRPPRTSRSPRGRSLSRGAPENRSGNATFTDGEVRASHHREAENGTASTSDHGCYKVISAVTGTIGCGKSTFFGFFRRRGWTTFDADGFCRSLYEENDPELAEAIRSRCGDRCFAADGVTIDRRRVGEAAFADPGLLDTLTAVLYPRLDAALDEAIARTRAAGGDLAAEIPLLFEKGYAPRFDTTIVVWCDDELRRRRLRESRGMSDEEIRRREACQWSSERKLEAADFAVVNHGTIPQLEEQFERLLAKLSPAALTA